MLIIEALRALKALRALSRLRVIHTWAQGSQGRLRVIHTWAQGSQSHQSQLEPSGPNHFSRAGLQTADAEMKFKEFFIRDMRKSRSSHNTKDTATFL